MSETASGTAQKSQEPGIQSVPGTQGTTQAQPVVHLHSSDQRFCGSVRPYRRFAIDTRKVTCALCRAAIEGPVAATVSEPVR